MLHKMNAKAIQMSFVRENGWMKNEYMHGGRWVGRKAGRHENDTTRND